MKRKPISYRDCERLKPGAPPLNDGHALSLSALASGRKVWRYRYRLAGKPGSFTIGYWPEIDLDQARELRAKAEAQVRAGTAPIIARRVKQQTQIAADTRTLGQMVVAWVEDRAKWEPGLRGAWVPITATGHRNRMRLFVLSHPIAQLPIDRVEPDAVVALLNAVPDYARNPVRIVLKKTFDRAVRFRMCQYNPVDVVREEIKPPRASTAHPAAATIADARAVLRAFEASRAAPLAKLAHRFIALTALRINEAGQLRWDWIGDLDAAQPVIEIPAYAMKGRTRPHIVCLAPQTVSLLRWAKRYRRHGEDYVFFGTRGRCASLCTRSIQVVLKRVSPIPFVVHGWRATFSTLMNERIDDDTAADQRLIADLMLAHKPQGISASEMHYQRARRLGRRHQVACEWADMLLEGAADLSAVCGGEMAAIGRQAEAA